MDRPRRTRSNNVSSEATTHIICIRIDEGGAEVGPSGDSRRLTDRRLFLSSAPSLEANCEKQDRREDVRRTDIQGHEALRIEVRTRYPSVTAVGTVPARSASRGIGSIETFN